jgi:hypothetical protein
VGNSIAVVSITGHISGKSLVFDVTCDQPVIKSLDMGTWGPVVRRKQIVTPYYSGQVFYLQAENLFTNAYLDWTCSNATSEDSSRTSYAVRADGGCSLQHDLTRANYAALTDGSYNRLKERAIFAAGWYLGEALPNIPNHPSPFMKQIGNRVVLDIWGGRYTDIAQKLRTLADYGISNCVALIHIWQRSGYDNALPMHFPAQADLGGDEGMKTLVQTGKELGYYMALHENYVDYYSNYDLFDEKDIAVDSDGKRQLAWYNSGTKMQSFAENPNAILRLARTQSPEIHRRYGTNACYLDVHSGVPPWFHVNMRAGEQDAGQFSRTWDVHGQLWQFERETHGGPVFGEGANHWYWSGRMDGVEAVFTVGWVGGGMNAPLMVDFDLLKIHPLQLNHGMGYYSGWCPEWSVLPPMVVLDQYRMQEIAYGHAGWLDRTTWSNIPLAWLEYHLMTPVTARYATAKPVDISYHVNGKWVDSSTAAKQADWSRVQISYDNGLTVTANNSPQSMKIGNLVVPQYGWFARGDGVTAYTAERNGVLADYAETADSIFANARNGDDWNWFGIRQVRPTVAEFKQVGPRTIRISYNWRVNEAMKAGYGCFVHFNAMGSDSIDEKVRFQQDHWPTVPTTEWKRGDRITDGPYTLSIPDDVADGDYDWRIGLYSISDGDRIALSGPDDGGGRIQLGVIRVRDAGKTITFVPETRTGERRAKLYAMHFNMDGKVVDFGTVRTSESVLIRREGNKWVLRSLPRDAKSVVEINAKRLPRPSSITCTGGTQTTVVPQSAGDWWKLQLNGSSRYCWPAVK